MDLRVRRVPTQVTRAQRTFWDFSVSKCWTAGTRNANVFPLPVFARTIISLPARQSQHVRLGGRPRCANTSEPVSAIGMVCDWIRVGRTRPILAVAFHRRASRPILVKAFAGWVAAPEALPLGSGAPGMVACNQRRSPHGHRTDPTTELARASVQAGLPLGADPPMGGGAPRCGPDRCCSAHARQGVDHHIYTHVPAAWVSGESCHVNRSWSSRSAILAMHVVATPALCLDTVASSPAALTAMARNVGITPCGKVSGGGGGGGSYLRVLPGQSGGGPRATKSRGGS